MNLSDILMEDDVISSVEKHLDILLELIPELKLIIGFEHKNPEHDKDVWNHTLYALSLSKKNIDVRLGLLLHDIGKGVAYQEGEVRHFRGHPQASAKLSKIILKRLDYSDDYIEKMTYLIANHDTPISNKMIEEHYDWCLLLYEMQVCDCYAHHPNRLERRISYLDKTKQKILLNNK